MAKRKKKNVAVEERTAEVVAAEVAESVDPVQSEELAENAEVDVDRVYEPLPEPLEYQVEPEVEPAPEPPSPGVEPVESRSTDRQPGGVQAVVQGRDDDESWKELVELSTISKQGAGFTISRECGVWRLLMMAIKMPREMRLYDHDEDVYPMLAVVQNCYATTRDDSPAFHVGVAFIGKRVPETYKIDPGQCYRITGMNKDGLWQVVEAANVFKTRRHSRFSRRLEVGISVRDKETRTSQKHRVFTKDVSVGGMSVWGPLGVQVGDRVKVSSEPHNFYAIALVRNRIDNAGDETKSLVNFEFEGADFPVQVLHPNAYRPEPDGTGDRYDDATKEAGIVLDSY